MQFGTDMQFLFPLICDGKSPFYCTSNDHNLCLSRQMTITFTACNLDNLSVSINETDSLCV